MTWCRTTTVRPAVHAESCGCCFDITQVLNMWLGILFDPCKRALATSTAQGGRLKPGAYHSKVESATPPTGFVMGRWTWDLTVQKSPNLDSAAVDGVRSRDRLREVASGELALYFFSLQVVPGTSVQTGPFASRQELCATWLIRRHSIISAKQDFYSTS